MKTNKLFCMGLLFLLAIGLTGCEDEVLEGSEETENDYGEYVETEWKDGPDGYFIGYVESKTDSSVSIIFRDGAIDPETGKETGMFRGTKGWIPSEDLNADALDVLDLLVFKIKRYKPFGYYKKAPRFESFDQVQSDLEIEPYVSSVKVENLTGRIVNIMPGMKGYWCVVSELPETGEQVAYWIMMPREDYCQEGLEVTFSGYLYDCSGDTKDWLLNGLYFYQNDETKRVCKYIDITSIEKKKE